MLASDALGLPVLLNLVGYVIGALILSPLADRFGRRDILLVTLIITGLGSLFNAFVGDYTTFIIARTITGIGVGADLALVATYINEVAPSNGRAKYTSLIFIMSSLGAFVGVWLGLALTTPPANFPNGLSFAQAVHVQLVRGARPVYGRRLAHYVWDRRAVGARRHCAALPFAGIAALADLADASRKLRRSSSEMEQRALRRRCPACLQSARRCAVSVGEKKMPPTWKCWAIRSICAGPFCSSACGSLPSYTVYTIGSGLTTILAGLGYAAPEAGTVVGAVGVFGFVAVAVFSYFFGEALERKLWLPLGALLTLIGGILIAVAGKPDTVAPTVDGTVILAFVGSIILFFGFNICGTDHLCLVCRKTSPRAPARPASGLLTASAISAAVSA